jgi:DNA-binding transcriptional LysR family regulator
VDLLVAFRTFVRITETGSFSAVAREIGATQPAISRQIAQLEEHLGVRVFQRSTRSLTLTEDGRDLLTHARLVLDSVAEAEAAIGRRRGTASGLVRLGCPTVFGRVYIAPRIGALLERHPGLSVELSVADDIVDMVQQGLDIAIRVGEIADPSLVARKVGSTTPTTIASPAYLQQRGEPTQPSDLTQHECIIFTRGTDPTEWVFTGPEGTVSVTVQGRFRSNGIEAVLAATIHGVGISRMPAWMARDALQSGEVRRVLAGWRPKPRPIFAVYPSRRFLAPRTRAVIDFLVDEFRLDPLISAYGED